MMSAYNRTTGPYLRARRPYSRKLLFLLALTVIAGLAAAPVEARIAAAAHTSAAAAPSGEPAAALLTGTMGAPVTGTVLDRESGEPLPGAHIRIDGTYTGTTANRDGRFGLSPGEFPVTLIVSFVGYETRELTLDVPAGDLVIELEPGTVTMDELVVTDADDRAARIMQRVIDRKKQWRRKLDSWKAEAYTRQNLRNDEGIVSITETYSTSWWHRERGAREVITDKRQTDNMLPEQNFAASSLLPNLYDDEIDIGGFEVVGVTHPEALDYYEFDIIGRREVDGDRIYDISVSPKRRLQPLFKGEVSVLAGEYALLEVDLTPNDVVRYPRPVTGADVAYQQSFSSYGGDFWLPVDIRMEGNIEIGIPGLRFPQIGFSQVTSVSRYEVNVPVPDSLYRRTTRPVVSDTQSVRRSERFAAGEPGVPLTRKESEAYETIDSTHTLDDAFKPSGLLARLLDWQDGVSFGGDGGSDGDEDAGEGRDAGGDESGQGGEPPGKESDRPGEAREGADASGRSGGAGLSLPGNLSYTPQLRYNRVEALYVGLQPEYRLGSGVTIEGLAGYGAGQQQWSYGGGMTWRTGRSEASLRYTHDAAERVDSPYYGRTATSAGPLLGQPGYHDHYRRKRLQARLARSIDLWDLRPEIRLLHEVHRSQDKTTDYSLPGGFTQRENMPVDEGTLRAVQLAATAGSSPAPLHITGGNGLRLTLEHSNKDLLGSDFTFTRLEGSLDFRFTTFLQRRLIPNTLDLRLRGFTSMGGLPLQRHMGIDGTLTGASPFGVFRSSPNRPVEGEHGAALFWEHNFQTVPLELLGLSGLADRGIGVILAGGHGRTWISETRRREFGGLLAYDGQWRHEATVSINNLFSLLRFDTTVRLDEPGLFFGLGVTRFF